MAWLARVTVKLGVLGLAALGAQRVVELAKPRLASLRRETVPAVQDAVQEANHVVRHTATNLRTDVYEAASHARGDLVPAADELKQAAGEAADAVHAAFAGTNGSADIAPTGLGTVSPQASGHSS